MTLTLLVASPVSAHTTEQLDAWTEDWAWSLWAQGGITHQLFMQRWDMANRHPCYFGRWDCRPSVPTKHTHPVTLAPVPVAAPRTYNDAAEQWRPLVAQHFPAAQVDTAICIIWFESRGLASADNPESSALGLWQHMGRYWPARSSAAGVGGSARTDPVAATIVAEWLWRTSGWHHWTVWRPNCR